MAMFLLRYRLSTLGLDKEYEVSSAGLETSTEGMDMEKRAKEQLDLHHIPYTTHAAHMLRPYEFREMDIVLYMESYNRVLISREMSGMHLEKTHRLLDYTDEPKNIADPNFTHDFKTAYEDIEKGVDAFVKKEILKQ